MGKAMKQEKVKLYSVYTGIFIVVVAGAFAWFVGSGKSFVWNPDGINQHYNVLAYFSEYLRELVSNFFHGNFEIKQYDFSIGYGADILTSLNYYAIGDPLNLLAVFVPTNYVEYLYDFLVLLRIYLAGLAFMVFCCKMQHGSYETLIGAILYAFCGFTFFSAVRHPYFINPMIYLPLLLLGIEKIFRRERPYLFLGMITLSAVSNFYFFYMLSILMFIYAVFRFLFHYRHIYGCSKKYGRLLVQFLWKFIGYYLVGLLLSAIIFIPVVAGFFSCGRGATQFSVDAFYAKNFYREFFSQFVTANGLNRWWTVLGFGVIVVYSISLLFCERKRTDLKLGFLLLSAILLLPIGGKVMNGMAYVSNRWCFAYSMMVAYITVTMLPTMLSLGGSDVRDEAERKRGWRRRVVCLAVLILYVGWQIIDLGIYRTQMQASAILLSVCLLLLFLMKGKALKVALLLLCMLNIIVNAGLRYSSSGSNYVSQFIDSGKCQETLEEAAAGAVAAGSAGGFYRFDQNYYGESNIVNTELQLGNSRSGYYYSIANGYVVDYLNENYHDNKYAHRSDGLSGRAMLEALAGVKYFVAGEGKEAYVPYGYRYLQSISYEDGTKNYDVYENTFSLPLGYTYDSYLTREYYDALPVEKKQQALLQSVLLEENLEGITQGMPSYSDIEIPYQIKYNSDQIKVSANSIEVLEPNATVTIHLKDNISQGELYVKFKNLWFHPITRNGAESDTITVITLETNSLIKSFELMTPLHQFYFNNHDYYMNLNESTRENNQITISFSRLGTYTFDELKVIGQPMEQYEAEIHERTEEVLDNVEIASNEITGTISVTGEKVLCLSIPYSTGWRAWVDGKEIPVMQANTMYMALALDQGHHQIVLRYSTPMMKVGAVLSILGLLALIVLIAISESHFRTKKTEVE